MIAPRRSLRLACMVAVRAAGSPAPAFRPLPLRWRRVHAAVGARAVPGRLASCIVQLQQHLHVRIGAVNVEGWGAAAAQAPGAGRPGMPGRDRLLGWSAMGRAVLPAGGRAAAPGRPWTTPAPLARQAPPVAARPAQIEWTQAGRAPTRAAGAGAAIAAPAMVNRAPTRQPGAAALPGATQEIVPGRLRAGLRAPPRPALPMRHTMLHRAHPGTQRTRLAAQHASVPAQLVRRLPSQRAATRPTIAAIAPAMLEWRSQAHGGPSAPGPTQWSQGDVAAPLARYVADSATAMPASRTAPGITANIAPGIASAFPALDSAAADRLAEDVVRRVERRLRIERERRGL